jgi:Ser/Thr protein kinase RdoA (MazF antagonist)
MATDFYQLPVEQQADLLQGVAKAALTHWNMSANAEIRLLKHRENAVFEIIDGERHMVLRVHRANYHTDQELLSELQWIQAINSEALRTPQVIPTTRGELFICARAEGVPEERQVDAFEWVDGAALGSVEDGLEDTSAADQSFRTMGQLMAIAHNHAEYWQLPEGFSRHAWDEEGLLGSEPFWGSFWDLPELTQEQRQRMLKVRDRGATELRAYAKSADRYGLIHADFVPENLLLTKEGVWLIDFDDCGFGWHLFDIATSLFFHLGQDYFESASNAFFDGYTQHRALPDQCMELLPLFFLLRGTTYLGWMHTRREITATNDLVPIIIAMVDDMAKEYL